MGETDKREIMAYLMKSKRDLDDIYIVESDKAISIVSGCEKGKPRIKVWKEQNG